MTEHNLIKQIEITAPVYIPNRDKLAIGLVPSDLVYKLEEYRSDERRWEAVTWSFIGAVLGVIVNWATTDPITISRGSLFFLLILIIMIVITGLAARDYAKRADIVKKRILSFETGATGFPEKLRIRVADFTGSKIVTAEVPTSPAMARLVPALVTKMNLPEGSYRLYHKESRRLLEANDTLESARISEGDTFRLLPNITASS